MKNKTIEFNKNNILYKGTVHWSAGATGAGFHIDIESPVKIQSATIKYFSTHDGKLFNEPLETFYEKVILDTVDKNK